MGLPILPIEPAPSPPARNELPFERQAVTRVRERRLIGNDESSGLHADKRLERLPRLVRHRLAGRASRVPLVVRVFLVVVLGAEKTDLGVAEPRELQRARPSRHDAEAISGGIALQIDEEVESFIRQRGAVPALQQVLGTDFTAAARDTTPVL